MLEVINLSFKEMINKRIIHVGLILTLIYLLIYGIGLHYLQAEYSRHENQVWFVQQLGYQFLCLGCYISTFLVGTLALMAGAGSISREIESGTILSLASKPLGRGSIVSGKFCAYSLLSMIYSSILLSAIAGLTWYYFRLPIKPVDLLLGLAIFMLFPVLLLAVAHLFSSLMSTMATGVISFMFFAVAIIGGFIEQIGALIQNTGMINIGVVSSLLMPTDAIYRMAIARIGGMIGGGAIAEFGPFGATSVPSNWMLLYACVYIGIIFVLTMYTFKRRDL